MKIKLKQPSEYAIRVLGGTEEGFVVPGLAIGGEPAILVDFDFEFLYFEGTGWEPSLFQFHVMPGTDDGTIDPEDNLKYPGEFEGPMERLPFWARQLAESLRPTCDRVGNPVTEIEVSE